MSHDDIRAALEARSDLPWRPSHGGPVATRPSDTYDVLDNDGETVAASLFYLDAHLIANAPTWLAELLAEVDEAQAEAMDVGHDYDRRGERLWRLAALAGWTPGNEADNDATAESYVRERLAEVDRLSHWKAEALPVIDGLQELGAELGIRLGGRITGPDALAAVKALTARAEAAEAERDQLREEARNFAQALGFGDGRTEPAATLAELVDPLTEAMSDSREHQDCPVFCEFCGERLAAVTCEACRGSGCLPNAEMAYLECGTCAGVGKVHNGCAEMTYAQLAASAEAAEQAIQEVSRLAMLDRKCPACSGYDAILGALGGGEQHG